MTGSIWWDLTRASANVAWGVILFAILWGVLLSTRILRGIDSPAWLRDLHCWLGGLTVVFSALHMATLIADTYVDFSVVDVLVPFTSTYRPWPVAAGVLGFWCLMMVEMTSIFMKKMSRTTWRRIHQLSWPLYGIIAVHALTAGSDVGTPLYTGFSMALSMTGAAVGGVRWVAGRSAARRTAATKS